MELREVAWKAATRIEPEIASLTRALRIAGRAIDLLTVEETVRFVATERQVLVCRNKTAGRTNEAIATAETKVLLPSYRCVDGMVAISR